MANARKKEIRRTKRERSSVSHQNAGESQMSQVHPAATMQALRKHRLDSIGGATHSELSLIGAPD